MSATSERGSVRLARTYEKKLIMVPGPEAALEGARFIISSHVVDAATDRRDDAPPANGMRSLTKGVFLRNVQETLSSQLQPTL